MLCCVTAQILREIIAVNVSEIESEIEGEKEIEDEREIEGEIESEIEGEIEGEIEDEVEGEMAHEVVVEAGEMEAEVRTSLGRKKIVLFSQVLVIVAELEAEKPAKGPIETVGEAQVASFHFLIIFQVGLIAF